MSNQLVAVPDQVRALRAFLEAPTVQAELRKAIPTAMEPGRLVRQVMTLVQGNPDLLRCSQASTLAGIMRAAELGLELSGPLGHAYLVPRYNGRAKAMEAQFQTGWKGLIALAFRSGHVAAFHVRTVHSNDSFAIRYGTDPHIDHDPEVLGDPGDPVGYYAVVFYKGGGKDFEYMTRLQCLDHRQKYAPPKDGKPDYSAWATSEEAMCRKTVVRKLCMRLALCPQAQNQAAEEEHQEVQVREEPQSLSRTQEVAARLDEMFGPAADPQEVGPQEVAGQ